MESNLTGGVSIHSIDVTVPSSPNRRTNPNKNRASRSWRRCWWRPARPSTTTYVRLPLLIWFKIVDEIVGTDISLSQTHTHCPRLTPTPTKSTDHTQRCQSSRSALYMACEFGNWGVAQLLLQRGANPGFRRQLYGRTCLQVSSQAGGNGRRFMVCGCGWWGVGGATGPFHHGMMPSHQRQIAAYNNHAHVVKGMLEYGCVPYYLLLRSVATSPPGPVLPPYPAPSTLIHPPPKKKQ